MDSKKRVSCAWQELTEFPVQWVQKYEDCVHLDLTNNSITDITRIGELQCLETLILDGNNINHYTFFPKMTKLDTLWVNRNHISNLALFLDKLVEATPNLRHLSMLNNDACPNYFNGGSLKQYNDYRHYTISRLRNLVTLDDAIITPEEKEQSLKIYGKMEMTIAREAEERKRLEELEAKRNQKRLERRKKLRKKKQLEKKKKEEAEVAKLLPNVSTQPIYPPPPPNLKSKNNNDSDSENWTDEDDDSDWSSDDDRKQSSQNQKSKPKK